ncbi:MAG TPA: leucyl aminopeptidase [Smithellaceae bacterium]|nr:leucyl aminopeptidase [Smithellaceae bacterium]
MKITVVKGKLVDAKAEAIILALFERENRLSGVAAEVDAKSGGLLSDVIKSGDFEAKPSQVSMIYSRTLAAKRIALVGLGKKNELTPEKIRRAFAKVMQELRGSKVRKAAVSLDLSLLNVRKEKVVSAAVEGAVLGLYRYSPYKTVGREELQDVQEMTIVPGPKDYALVRDEVQKTKIIADAVCFARDLVSAPANEMTPSILAEQARVVAKRKNVSCRVLEKGQMKALGMNALLGVAAGSDQPPKLIVLEYTGGKKGEAPIALVGKGLTFDSGGISIKPAEKMDEMKTDMAGGAAVLAVIRAAADLKLPVHLVGLVPATENLSGGSALKPGDVLKSHSGRTIEVLNTDAEGRLILADALSYACRYKPSAIIDIATLTGACVVALGEEVAGMLGTDDRMKKALREAADATGELIWELPLWDHYHELIKSDIADYKNSAGRLGGAITGAAFLSKFVGDYPWVHLDIAGPAWTTKDRGYIPKGASGVPVRLLMEFLQNRVQEKK